MKFASLTRSHRRLTSGVATEGELDRSARYQEISRR